MELADVEIPEDEAGEIEWMPLGVFALSTSQEESQPSILIQLAVSKDGIIQGVYQNTTTNDSKPIQGSVDRETQRAAWSIGDNKETVMETGLFNLTENEAPVLVHFGAEERQTWLLVRLPEQGETEQTKQ
jgi:hypothetical protein